MDKSSPALPVRLLIVNPVRDGKGASPGRIDELMIDLDSAHAKSVVLTMGDMPKSGNAAGAIPGERFRPEPGDTSAAQTSNEQLDSGSGKPDKEHTFFVYTYSVGRVH